MLDVDPMSSDGCLVHMLSAGEYNIHSSNSGQVFFSFLHVASLRLGIWVDNIALSQRSGFQLIIALQVFKVARKNARKFWQPARDPKRNEYHLECSMDLPGNRPRVARKKYWRRFMKCTMRFESHLVTLSAKRFQKSPAKCPAFSFHFLPSPPFFTFYAVRSNPFGRSCPWKPKVKMPNKDPARP